MQSKAPERVKVEDLPDKEHNDKVTVIPRKVIKPNRHDKRVFIKQNKLEKRKIAKEFEKSQKEGLKKYEKELEIKKERLKELEEKEEEEQS